MEIEHQASERRPHRVLVPNQIAFAVPVPLRHLPDTAGPDRVTHAPGSYAWAMSAQHVDVTRDGDIVTVEVDVPSQLTDEQRAAVEQLAAATTVNPRTYR